MVKDRMRTHVKERACAALKEEAFQSEKSFSF